MSVPTNIHRELTSTLGYRLQFEGISLGKPGYRYIGVTYQQVMRDVLKNLVGDAAWIDALVAPESLEPSCLFQFLPQYKNPGWFLTFMTLYGIYGITWALGDMDLKYVMRDARRNKDYEWIFNSALVYSKPSAYSFKANPLCDNALSTSPGIWPSSFKSNYTGLPMPWERYVADPQAFSVRSLAVGDMGYAVGDSLIGDPIGDPYGNYNNLKSPWQSSWPGWEPPSSLTYTREIDKNSAMGIELEARRQRDLEQAELEKTNKARLAWTTRVAGWESLGWYQIDQTQGPQATTPDLALPEAADNSFAPSKFGRKIRFAAKLAASSASIEPEKEKEGG